MDESPRAPVYVIGSLNTDLVVKTGQLPAPGQTVLGGDFFMNPGGKGGNQAGAAARLGASVALVARLGTDIFADAAMASLERDGLTCTHVSRDPDHPSGVALISIDAAGENQIVVAPGANAALSPADVEHACGELPAGALVLLQLEVPMESVQRTVAIATERHCRVILDPAPAPEGPLPRELLGGVYLLTPNETEAQRLTGLKVTDQDSAQAAAGALINAGATHVAVTLGAAGVCLAHQNQTTFIPAPQVTAVDSTAAGDCFNGAVAAGLAQGLDLIASVEFGCRAAAVSVTRLGAQDAMPSAADVA